MVFASSAIAQAAALGVALSFWIPAIVDPSGHAAGHAAGPAAHVAPSLLFEPVLWAIAASLLATLVFVANPVHLHLTRESLLGFVFLASGAGAVIVGDRDHPGGARPGGDPVRQRGGRAARSISILVAMATVILLGGHVVLLARAAVRRLRPDGRARAGHAGARAQRVPVPVGRPVGRAVHARAGRAAGVRVQRAARDDGAGAHRAHRPRVRAGDADRRALRRGRLRGLVPRRPARRRHPDRRRRPPCSPPRSPSRLRPRAATSAAARTTSAPRTDAA